MELIAIVESLQRCLRFGKGQAISETELYTIHKTPQESCLVLEETDHLSAQGTLHDHVVRAVHLFFFFSLIASN